MSDLIKREDAIATIGVMYERCDTHDITDYRDMMLESAKALPSADRPQGEVDAIDRDALIDYCLKLIDVERKQGSDVMNYGQERVNQTEAIIDYIEHMPHVNADRPPGEWILECDAEGEDDNLYRCSECGCNYGCQEYDIPNFCPNCGAQMKGADDE